MSFQSSVNPYQVNQPSPRDPRVGDSLAGDSLDDHAYELSFRLTKGGMRHAVDHLLLHRHPWRLSIGSLLMILASGAGIFWAASDSFVAFLVTSALAMGLSTLIYTLLIHRSKTIMRKRILELGLIPDSICVIRTDDRDLVILSSNGEHRWSIDNIKTFRTPFGILFCPDPMTPIYVPRRNNSPHEALKNLRQRLSEKH